ncbi:hypothetical protein BDR03DRAFT_984952 [Suillus americanus]|nr:hypothetical protein BDR03DRAFT_984952 [Suillus americanus]
MTTPRSSVNTDTQIVAQKIIKSMLAHLEELRSVIEQEVILAESHWREVESVDVFYNSHMFEKAAVRIRRSQKRLPPNGWVLGSERAGARPDKLPLCSEGRPAKCNVTFGFVCVSARIMLLKARFRSGLS